MDEAKSGAGVEVSRPEGRTLRSWTVTANRRHRTLIEHAAGRAAAHVCLVWMAAGCSGATIVLGDRDPPRYRFGTPAVVAELADPAKTDNPSLTGDMLEIFFTSERSRGPSEIWTAVRDRASTVFEAPRLVSELNSPAIETSPVVSPDGLTLWFSSDRAAGAGGFDVWVAERADRRARWSVPQPVVALNSAWNDYARPPGQHGLVMPLGSDRDRRGFYSIYFAARAAPGGEFEEPEAMRDLEFPGASTLDGFLTEDGHTLFYVSGPSIGPADLYVSMRRDVADAFGEPVALDDLNTPSDERDPWLSADGKQFFFSSDRSGRYEIYVAPARLEPAAAQSE